MSTTKKVAIAVVVIAVVSPLLFRAKPPSRSESSGPVNYYAASAAYVPGPNECSDNLIRDSDFLESSLGAWTGDIENITGDSTRGYVLMLGGDATSTAESVTQTVQIPATGNASLSFQLRTEGTNQGNPEADRFDVLFDGVSLLDSPILGNDSTYQRGFWPVQVDVSTFADGNPHQLEFETVQTGGTAFFVDYISLSTGSDCSGSWGIDLSPYVLMFGYVEQGASKTLNVNVYNTGSTPLVGAVEARLPFYIDKKLAEYTIAPGAGARLPITYRPTNISHDGDYVEFSGGGNEKLLAVGYSRLGIDWPSNREVILNEITPWNVNGVTDEEHDHSDWIELFNYNGQSISLEGWQLEYTPNGGTTMVWAFPAQTTIGPGDFALVYASGKSGTNSDAGMHANFTLDETTGGTLALRNADGELTLQSPLDMPPSDTPDGSFAYVDPGFLTNRPDPNNSGPAVGHWQGIPPKKSNRWNY